MDDSSHVPRGTGALAPHLASWLGALLRERGDAAAAELVGVHPQTVVRAAVGLDVRPSVAIAIDAAYQRSRPS